MKMSEFMKIFKSHLTNHEFIIKRKKWLKKLETKSNLKVYKVALILQIII